jgi:hypothetical protein
VSLFTQLARPDCVWLISHNLLSGALLAPRGLKNLVRHTRLQMFERGQRDPSHKAAQQHNNAFMENSPARNKFVQQNLVRRVFQREARIYYFLKPIPWS